MLVFFKKIFDLLKVPYTIDWLSTQLEETPHINTMLGVSALLWKYNIENNVVRLTVKDDIKAIQLPCIALYKDQFIIIESVYEHTITYYSPTESNKTLELISFFNEWNGIIMLLEKSNNSKEQSYHSHRKKEIIKRIKKYSFVIFAIALVCYGTYINPLDHLLSWWILLLINLTGIGVSYLLLQKDLHISNKFSDKLCRLVKDANCDSVVQSNGSNLLGIVKLSELGTGFFTVNAATFLFMRDVIPALAIISLIVLPFSFWSIWYQKYKVKQWCTLCLATLGIMWIQTGIFVINFNLLSFENHRLSEGLSILIVLYCLVVLLINHLIEKEKSINEKNIWKRKFIDLKFNDEVITAIEGKAPTYLTDSEKCSAITFGRPDASYHITIFSNPYCGPCADMHWKIKDFPNLSVRITYVFTYFSEDKSDINKLFIAAYQQLGENRAWDILTEWYDGGKEKGRAFFDQFNLNVDDSNVEKEFLKQKEWRHDERLHATPTVIVNDREVVAPYTVDEYMFLSDLRFYRTNYK